MNKPDLKPSERIKLTAPTYRMQMEIQILDELHETNTQLRQRIADGERAMRILAEEVGGGSIEFMIKKEQGHKNWEWLLSFLSPKK